MRRSASLNKFWTFGSTLNTPERKTGILIITRPKPEAAATHLDVGDRGAVGLMAFRVLPNFTLASERSSRVMDVGK